MWIESFLCLLLAHLVADFGLQTSASCKSKAEKDGGFNAGALIGTIERWLILIFVNLIDFSTRFAWSK